MTAEIMKAEDEEFYVKQKRKCLEKNIEIVRRRIKIVDKTDNTKE